MKKPRTHRTDPRIGTWRASTVAQAPAAVRKDSVSPTIRFIAPPPAPAPDVAVAPIPPRVFKPGAPSSPIKRVLLDPSANQREVLDSIFEGPKTLLHLLRLYPAEICSIEDASRFLDKYIRRLAPLLLKRGNGQGVKQLEELIWNWSQKLPDYVSFTLPARCWISEDQNICLPIPQLEVLAPKNRPALGRLRKGRRFWTDFVLVCDGPNYSIDVEFVTGSMSTEPRPPQSPQRPPTKPSKGQRSNIARAQPHYRAIPLQEYLNYFDNLVLQKLRQELEVSRQFSTTRFSDLSGWPVSGGLPSLPRRR